MPKEAVKNREELPLTLNMQEIQQALWISRGIVINKEKTMDDVDVIQRLHSSKEKDYVTTKM